VASLSVGEIKRNNFVRFSPVQPVPLTVQSLSQLSIRILNSEGKLLEELNAEAGANHFSKYTFVLSWLPTLNHWLP
jgi:hypothetical protein